MPRLRAARDTAAATGGGGGRRRRRGVIAGADAAYRG
eukprot:gene8357-18795_t